MAVTSSERRRGMRVRGGLMALALVAGCAAAPTGSASSGAAPAARSYSEALVRADWDAAYGLLHPDSRAKYTRDRFASLAQNYCRGLGLDPDEVRLRA